MTHAVFSPSAAKRWMACPGSFKLNQGFDDSSSSYADDGTTTHDLAFKVLSGAMKLAEAKALAPDPSYGDALVTYVEWATDLKKQIGGSKARVAYEQRVAYNEELFGTADFLGIDAARRHMHVGDLKCGAGVYVHHVENAQMLTYAYLALHSLPSVWTLDLEEVSMYVIQPRFPGAQPIRPWSCGIEVIREWGHALARAMEAAKAPDAPLVPGDEQCQWCRAKTACPKLQGLTTDLMRPALVEATPDQIGDWLRKVELAEQFIKALRDSAHKLVTDGVAIPGWKLEPKRATRKWLDDRKVIAAATKHGIDVRVESVMSPAALEKHLKDKLPASLEKLVTAESSGFNLVKDKDYVPALAKPVAKQPPAAALRNLKHRV